MENSGNFWSQGAYNTKITKVNHAVHSMNIASLQDDNHKIFLNFNLKILVCDQFQIKMKKNMGIGM